MEAPITGESSHKSAASYLYNLWRGPEPLPPTPFPLPREREGPRAEGETGRGPPGGGRGRHAALQPETPQSFCAWR